MPFFNHHSLLLTLLIIMVTNSKKYDCYKINYSKVNNCHIISLKKHIINLSIQSKLKYKINQKIQGIHE